METREPDALIGTCEKCMQFAGKLWRTPVSKKLLCRTCCPPEIMMADVNWQKKYEEAMERVEDLEADLREAQRVAAQTVDLNNRLHRRVQAQESAEVAKAIQQHRDHWSTKCKDLYDEGYTLRNKIYRLEQELKKVKSQPLLHALLRKLGWS